MSKDKEIFGLLKLPDELVIKGLQIEIGKANSYILELEEKIVKLEKISRPINAERLVQLQNENKNLKRKLNKLTQTN